MRRCAPGAPRSGSGSDEGGAIVWPCEGGDPSREAGRYVGPVRDDAVRCPTSRTPVRTAFQGKVRPPASLLHLERFAPLACGQRPCETRSPAGRDVGRRPTMLVLTRKSNQSIMIGDDIEVSVLSIMGEKVRIGIQAPRDIPVFRKEVYLEIQQERNGAANGSNDLRGEVDEALRKLGTAAPTE